MARVHGWRWVREMVAFCGVMAVSSHAQTFTSLVSFDGQNGWNSVASLAQGVDGDLYGSTRNGGAEGTGTIFRISRSGDLVSHSLCIQLPCTEGSYPMAGMVLATDGNLYGTTAGGGADFDGTIYRITPEGGVSTLFSFGIGSGDQPEGALLQGIDGSLYGTTTVGFGTIFKITTAGLFSVIYRFCSQTNCADGNYPVSGLTQSIDGNFYGTTSQGGGPLSKGTVFKITPAGTLTTLYTFCSQEPTCTDGSTPMAGLLRGTDGNFYGTTELGGRNNAGTVFRITSSGVLTTLYSFCSKTNCSDGAIPISGLVETTDGNLYGVTEQGGGFCSQTGCGTIFKITRGGMLTTVHRFSGTDGAGPSGGLVQATDGSLYGTTSAGGTSGIYGTVFKFDMGLGPFIAFVLPAGKVGQAGGILGQGFTGTTSVTLNGTPVPFTVKSDTYILATVPTGATSGYVTVTTPSGTLTSNAPFRVIK